jgi:hypothetical protein
MRGHPTCAKRAGSAADSFGLADPTAGSVTDDRTCLTAVATAPLRPPAAMPIGLPASVARAHVDTDPTRAGFDADLR